MYRHQSKKQFQRRIDKAIRRADIFAIMKRLNLPFRIRGRELWYQCRVYNHKVKSWKSTKILSNPIHRYHGFWKCFSCGESGTIISLVQISEDINFMEALAIVERYQLDIDESKLVKPLYKQVIDLPKFYISPNKKSEWDKEFLDFLLRRGITWEQIIKHRIGYVDAGYYNNRIIAPVMLNHEMQTFIARSIIPGIDPTKKVTSAPNGQPGLFGSEFARPERGPAIICEGFTDQLHIERVGYPNAMSIQTSQLHESQFEFIKRFPYTIAIPDGDQAGRKFIDKLAPWIDDHNFLVSFPPEGEDPDSVSDEMVEDIIGNAKPWKPSPEDFGIEIED